MKKNVPILLLLLYCSSLFASNKPTQSKVLEFPTFELLSGQWDEREKKWRRYTEKDKLDLERFATNYQKKARFLFYNLPNVFRIPRVLNFIWVGPKAFPEDSIPNLLAWKELHPEWKMRFWTDSKERACPIEGMEKHLVDELNFLFLKPYMSRTTNYGEKADIIRYEVIFQQGGVYVDHDVMPYRAFDTLNGAFDFYVGLENPHTNPGMGTKVFPCNCLFGARAFHPILKQTIENIIECWDRVERQYPGNDPREAKNRVLNRTFNSFTLATKKCLNMYGNSDMVLPSSFFFAYKIFPKNTRDLLKSHGLVFARHDFASVWTNNAKKKEESKSLSSSKKSSVSDSSKTSVKKKRRS